MSNLDGDLAIKILALACGDPVPVPSHRGLIVRASRRDGSLKYYARYMDVDGTRRCRATKAKTLEAAQEWLRLAKVSVSMGKPGAIRDQRRMKYGTGR